MHCDINSDIHLQQAQDKIREAGAGVYSQCGYESASERDWVLDLRGGQGIGVGEIPGKNGVAEQEQRNEV
jgi:hypothetical protein